MHTTTYAVLLHITHSITPMLDCYVASLEALTPRGDGIEALRIVGFEGKAQVAIKRAESGCFHMSWTYCQLEEIVVVEPHIVLPLEHKHFDTVPLYIKLQRGCRVVVANTKDAKKAIALFVSLLCSRRASATLFMTSHSFVSSAGTDAVQLDITLISTAGSTPVVGPPTRCTQSTIKTLLRLPFFRAIQAQGACCHFYLPQDLDVCVEMAETTPSDDAAPSLLVTLVRGDSTHHLWAAIGGSTSKTYFTLSCAHILACAGALTTMLVVSRLPPKLLAPAICNSYFEGTVTSDGVAQLHKMCNTSKLLQCSKFERQCTGSVFFQQDVYFEAYIAVFGRCKSPPADLSEDMKIFGKALLERSLRSDMVLPIAPLTIDTAILVALRCHCLDAAIDLTHIQAMGLQDDLYMQLREDE
jgi:hypothetical protein